MHKILLLTICLAYSCAKKKINSDQTLDNTCWEGRAEENEIINEIGEILILNDVYLIQVSDSKRYVVCDVPYEFSTAGLNVLFSGFSLEIRPNERLMGRPLKLTALRVAS